MARLSPIVSISTADYGIKRKQITGEVHTATGR